MRRVLLVLVLVVAGCGPSDTAKAWCSDHPYDLAAATWTLNVPNDEAHFNQLCDYAFNHQSGN